MIEELECDGWGPVPSRLMFVGISAGRLGALVSKVPLTKDASGRVFQRCLQKIGLSESDEFSESPSLKCYVTNLVKGRCLTPKGLNRLPTVKEVEYWWPTFERELERVRPYRIVALGEFVWRHLYRKGLRSPRLVSVPHPRWYNSHGALGGSPAFDIMLRHYESAVKNGLNQFPLRKIRVKK